MLTSQMYTSSPSQKVKIGTIILYIISYVYVDVVCMYVYSFNMYVVVYRCNRCMYVFSFNMCVGM